MRRCDPIAGTDVFVLLVVLFWVMSAIIMGAVVLVVVVAICVVAWGVDAYESRRVVVA